MAKIRELDDEAWQEWVSGRPESVQRVCAKLPPDRLYMLKTNGHRVTIESYSEDGTMTVNVTGEYNRVIFDRSVFGIKPEDLEECDLPGEDEDNGAMLTDDNSISAFIDMTKVLK